MSNQLNSENCTILMVMKWTLMESDSVPHRCWSLAQGQARVCGFSKGFPGTSRSDSPPDRSPVCLHRQRTKRPSVIHSGAQNIDVLENRDWEITKTGSVLEKKSLLLCFNFMSSNQNNGTVCFSTTVSDVSLQSHDTTIHNVGITPFYTSALLC